MLGASAHRTAAWPVCQQNAVMRKGLQAGRAGRDAQLVNPYNALLVSLPSMHEALALVCIAAPEMAMGTLLVLCGRVYCNQLGWFQARSGTQPCQRIASLAEQAPSQLEE